MNPTDKIRLAISTCPNDTFAFHGLLEKKVDWQGLDFDVCMLDIQELNEGLFNEEFDVAKASFHAALRLADKTVILPSGSALGFGVGPLLLASISNTRPDLPITPRGEKPRSAITLCPGEHTTATLLFQLFYGKTKEIKHVAFSEIMPALQTGQADFGVCIHEGRFTWRQNGLALVEDLGTRWESETGSPLPLGGLLAGRHLPDPVIARVQNVVRNSIRYGLGHREETLPTMRRYAQELNDDVLNQHVELYVNSWTVDLGDAGRRALKILSAKACESGIVPSLSGEIQVFPEN